MKIEVVNSYDEMSKKGKNFIVHEIVKNKSMLLCAATGTSPTGTYKYLADEYKVQPELFEKLRIIKLDEWGGVPMDESGSCESYLQTHVIQPLKIKSQQFYSWNSNPENPEQECERIQQKLEKEGPIDLCILGIGANGHLALIEPAEFLQSNCHVAELSKKSQEHKMAKGMRTKPAYGLTLGMADIFQSKKILMLITGSGKSKIVTEFLSKKISSQLPASFLWLHPDVFCLVDNESIKY